MSVTPGDLKPDTILVANEGSACITCYWLMSTSNGTSNYIAPELHKTFDEEARRRVRRRPCDMYALGCTIYAAYTGRDRFRGFSKVQITVQVMYDRRPDFPKGVISPDIVNLWSPKPSERLTCERAVTCMEHKAISEGIDTSLPTFVNFGRQVVPILSPR
ncbi:hypothetical protein PAXINDRAFT_8747 [Paxillus involutus ATCC 200175]|nr:hypothetical protein PAXINDRAFT_8747 [Paxillus involutus ATCC 200175]